MSDEKRIGLAVATAVILATTVPAALARRTTMMGKGWWGGGRHHQYYRYRALPAFLRLLPPLRHSYGYSHRRHDRSWWGGGRY